MEREEERGERGGGRGEGGEGRGEKGGGRGEGGEGRGKMGGGKGEKEMGRTIACIILISRNIEQLNYKYYYIIITSLVRHTCRYLEHSILFHHVHMYMWTQPTDSQTQKD